MSCESVREALPLLLDGDDVEQEKVEAHLNDCSACQELNAAYLADVQALSALRGAQESPAGLMDGFAQSVLDRVAEEGTKAGTVVAMPRGSSMRWAAAAAAVLLTVATVAVSRAPFTPRPEQQPVAEQPASPAPVVDRSLASEGLPPLPAPTMRDDAPMPTRRVGRAVNPDVLPADGRAGAGMGAGTGAAELEELMQRALPNLRRFFPTRERPQRERDDEVNF